MKFFQIPASNTSSGHDLGKVTLQFFMVHSDRDNTPFTLQLNFFVRGLANCPREIGEAFRHALQIAMPKLLTNGQKSPKEEMVEILEKMTAKTWRKSKSRLGKILNAF